LPIAQAAPTRHSRPAPEFLREHVPGNAAAEDKQNAGETRAIGDARPSAFRPRRWSWQERFKKIPQRIGKQCRGHTRSRYFADEDQVSAVLLHALRKKIVSQETILVTGAAGSVGSTAHAAIATLLQQGHRVRVTLVRTRPS